MTDIRKMMTNTMLVTDNPMAPVILQQAHHSVDSLGKLMAGIASKPKTQRYAAKMLDQLPSFERMSSEPEFIMALCSMLSESIVAWTKKTGKMRVPKN